MTRSWMVVVIMASLAAGYLLGNRSQVEAVPQAQPREVKHFNLYNSPLGGLFLLDDRTGDTWKWYRDEDAGGWQYYAKPSRINTCALESTNSKACFDEPMSRMAERGFNPTLIGPYRLDP